MSGRALVVFARAPVRGAVKTRLAGAVGEDAALALYQAFLDDTMSVAGAAAREAGAELELAVAGELALLARFADRARLVTQPVGDLGARMGAFIDRHTDAGRAICIIGSDGPQLATSQLARAFVSLDAHEVVVGPSRDGGYWLIGARRSVPELLADMPWSTPRVLPLTLERLAGRDHALLDELFDVDDADDLAYLAAWLASAPVTLAPATRRALAELGR